MTWLRECRNAVWFRFQECTVTHLETAPLWVTLRGMTWEGNVHIFRIEGNQRQAVVLRGAFDLTRTIPASSEYSPCSTLLQIRPQSKRSLSGSRFKVKGPH